MRYGGGAMAASFHARCVKGTIYVGALGAALVASPLADPRAAQADEPACDTVEVEYALSANLKLADTFMGAGDGVYRTGPGRVVVRWSHPEQEHGVAQMISYELHQPFNMETTALFWSAKLASDSTAQGTPDRCGMVASGSFAGRRLTWGSAVNGYHIDGNVRCEGSLCGRFGAPVSGDNVIRIAPSQVPFKPFEFAADRKTFTMDYVVVSRADSPKQTTLVSLAGREVRRACVAARPCS